MNSFRSSLSLSLIALVATLAGCGVEAGGPEAETASSEQAATVAATNEAATKSFKGGAHRGHGGPASLLMAALREDIGLTPEQRTTLEGLLPKRGERPEGAPAADSTRATALAAAIRSGKVDGVAWAKHAPEDASKHEAMKATFAKSLQTLHDTLSAEQRQKLVVAVQAHEGKGHDGPHHEGKERPEGHGPRAEGEIPGPLGHMLADFQLTADQKAQLKQKLEAARPAKPSEEQMAAHKKQFEAMRAEHQAKLASFANDSFDANTFLARPANAPDKPFAAMQNHHENELAILVSVLQPAQREQLAAKIEAGPAAFGKKPMRQ